MDIFAEKFQINGMAEILTQVGPDGLEPTVEGVVDYDYESQTAVPVNGGLPLLTVQWRPEPGNYP